MPGGAPTDLRGPADQQPPPGKAGLLQYLPQAISSGDVCGQGGREAALPIHGELIPTRANPYAVMAAMAAESLYHGGITEGWRALLVARPFSHIGPGLKPTIGDCQHAADP